MYFINLNFTSALKYYFAQGSYAKHCILRFYNIKKILEYLELYDKSIYQITIVDRSWKENERKFSFSKCSELVKVSDEGKVSPILFCNEFDHLDNAFPIKMIRKSRFGFNIEKKFYITEYNKYKSLVYKKCKYALKYSREIIRDFTGVYTNELLVI